MLFILFYVFFLSLKIISFWRMRTYLHKMNIGNNTCDASRDKKEGSQDAYGECNSRPPSATAQSNLVAILTALPQIMFLLTHQ